MLISMLLNSGTPLVADVAALYPHDEPVDPTGMYFVLDGSNVPDDPEQNRSNGPWWAQMVDISEIAPEGTPPLLMIASSDHFDTSNTDAGLYIWRADQPAGPWTFDGQFFASSATFPQMEAPTARVLTDPQDGQKKLFIWAHYVPIPYIDNGPQAHRQVSIALTSPDGVTAPLPQEDLTLDAALPQYDLSAEPYNAHLGYLTVGRNIFSGLVNPATGQPWTYIGSSMYGSQSSEHRMFGMALWGLDTPRDAPTLIERSVRDSRFIYQAPARMITTTDIGATFKDADGTLWGLFMTSGPGGFELRAAEMNRWGLVTSRATTLFNGTMIDPADFPAPFSDQASLKAPQWLSAYRDADGQIWAVLTVVLEEDGVADSNLVLIVPLGGTRAPAFNTDRPGVLRYHAQQATALSSETLGVQHTNAVQLNDPSVVLSPQDTWEILTWDTEMPLSHYELLRFQLNSFGEAGTPATPNGSDFWIFATPLTDTAASQPLSELPTDGFVAGAEAASGSDVFFGALQPGLQAGLLEKSRYLSIGRGVGMPDWRYDLGIALWPKDNLFGVTHSGDSLVETVSSEALDLNLRWRFGIASRQPIQSEMETTHKTQIQSITLTAIPSE